MVLKSAFHNILKLWGYNIFVVGSAHQFLTETPENKLVQMSTVPVFLYRLGSSRYHQEGHDSVEWNSSSLYLIHFSCKLIVILKSWFTLKAQSTKVWHNNLNDELPLSNLVSSRQLQV